MNKVPKKAGFYLLQYDNGGGHELGELDDHGEFQFSCCMCDDPPYPKMEKISVIGEILQPKEWLALEGEPINDRAYWTKTREGYIEAGVFSADGNLFFFMVDCDGSPSHSYEIGKAVEVVK